MGDPECRCDVPCERIDYGAKLSYSQLSEFNIDHNMISSVERQFYVKNKLQMAKETSQRVVESVVQENNNIFNQFIAIFNHLSATLRDARHAFDNTSIIMDEIQETINCEEFKIALQVDFTNFISETLHTFGWITMDIVSNSVPLKTFQEILYGLHKFLSDEFVTCLNNTEYDSENETSVSHFCHGQFVEKSAEIASWSLDEVQLILNKVVDDVMGRYDILIIKLFSHANISGSGMEEHEACTFAIDQFITESSAVIAQLFLCKAQVIQANNEVIKLVKALQIIIPMATKESVSHSLYTIIDKLYSCEWVKSEALGYYNTYNTLYKVTNDIIDLSNNLFLQITTLNDDIIYFRPLVDSGISRHLSIVKYVQFLHAFMENNMTKLQAANHIVTDRFEYLTDKLEIHKVYIEHTVSLIEEYQLDLEYSLSLWVTTYMSFMIPPFTMDIIRESKIVGLANRYYRNTLGPLLEEIENPHMSMSAYVNIIYELLGLTYGHQQNYGQWILSNVTQLLQAMDDTYVHLGEHKHSMVMDTNFYM